MKRYLVLFSLVIAPQAHVFGQVISDIDKKVRESVSMAVTEEDSLALVALYNSTNGDSWTNNTNWLTGQPLSTWHGITVSNGRVTATDLVFNNLVGTIPPEIGNLTNLDTLSLRTNQLMGSIPPEIGTLTNLTYLSLIRNQLSGSIPTAIGNLTNLTWLDFTYNGLESSIPVEIGNLTNLTFLGLAENELTGSIPTSIGKLTNLTAWTLHHNQLSGSIPTEIGKLRNLEILNADTNQLTGSIPSEIGDLINLSNLQFSENKFTGSIPSSIGKLTNVTNINLSENKLTGAVPQEAVNLTNMKSLKIYSNLLTALPDLSSITTLEALVAWSNRFTFEDIEPNVNIPGFTYVPQDSVEAVQDTSVAFGSSLTLSVAVGGDNNRYQWFQNGMKVPGATDSTYTISSFDSSDAGSYICEITNTVVTKLTLYRRPINVDLPLDLLPPVIKHDPPSVPEEGEAVLFTSEITDDAGVLEAQLSVRTGGDVSYFSFPMTSLGSNMYKRVIPASFGTPRGIDYYIEAKDHNNQNARDPEIGFYSLQVHSNDGVTKPTAQPGGNLQTGYRLISIPLILDDKTPHAVLADDLGEYDDTKWRFSELSPDGLSFTEFPDISNIKPCKAYWLIVKEPGKRIDTGAGKSNLTANEYQILLRPGWNFIGNPFNFTIPMRNVRLQSTGMAPDLRSYDGSWNNTGDPFTEIQPFEGYALRVGSQDRLLINPDLTETNLAALGLQRKPVTNTDIRWLIRIVAQCQAARDIDNIAAAAVEAAIGWDSKDLPEPPVIGEYVSVYFPHRDWKTLSKRFCTDFRPEFQDGEIWEFEVKSNIRDEVHLTFQGIESVPKEFEVWLVDEAVNVTRNLRAANHYAVAGSESHPKRLKLVVGKSDFIGNELAQIQNIPTDFELFQNFPNPFNPATTIRYGLPKEERVTLKVYNILGEEVVTLVHDEAKEAGYHAAIWDGRNNAGRVVASGIYIYQLRAGNFTMTKKMAFVR